MEQTAELYIVSRVKKLERENDELAKTIQRNEQQHKETLESFKSETQLWIKAFSIVEKAFDIRVEKTDYTYGNSNYRLWVNGTNPKEITEQEYISLKRVGVKDL